MNRRLFLQLPLAAAFASEARATDSDRPGKAFKVSAGASRDAEELLIMGGRFTCKISGKDTNGDLCVYDTVREAKGGPALHRHFFQDEWFYVIRGEFIVQVGEDNFKLGPGDSAFAPRRIPHTFAKVSDGEAQVLVLFQPAGGMEDFFKQMSNYGKNILENQEIVLKRLWEQHGMEVLGPPLKP